MHEFCRLFFNNYVARSLFFEGSYKKIEKK